MAACVSICVCVCYLFQQRGTQVETREGVQDGDRQLSVLLEQSAAETSRMTQLPTTPVPSVPPVYTLELSGYVVVLRVLQHLRQTGDNVTLNLHRRYRHQFHQFLGQFLQMTGHGRTEMITGEDRPQI